MEKNEIKDLAKKQEDEYSHEEILSDLGKIDWAIQGLNNLVEYDMTENIKEDTKKELEAILSVLPEQVKVLRLNEEIYFSRAKKDDKIIQIWGLDELQEYTDSLEEFIFPSNGKKLIEKIIPKE